MAISNDVGLFPFQAFGNDLVALFVSFAPNTAVDPGVAGTLSAGAISGTANGQELVSIIHTATGKFTITFKKAYPEMLAAFAHIQLSANADLKTQLGPYVPSSAGANPTVVVNVLAVNTLTDIAANANNRISCLFIFRRTGTIQV